MLDRRALLHFASGAALLAGLPARAFARPSLGDGEFPRQVEHVAGSTLVPREPRRVAVISTGQLDAALSLGVIPAGTARVDNRELAPAYLRRALASRATELDAMVDLGSRQAPDLEALARLAPDLILLNRTVLRAGGLELFSRIAPTVVARGTGGNWRPDFLLLAEALGRRQQAERLLAELDRDLAGMAQRLGSQPPSASLLFSSGARLRLMGKDSFAGGLLQAMGLTRPAAQRFKGTSQDVSAELLDLADADWLFYAEQGTALASLPRQPLWPRLEAVSQARAIKVDTDAFYLNAGPLAARQVVTSVATALGVA
ncbi:iron-siderophore ABC transporter substrate-binding protein [Pseudomonas oryzihabitans]|uniref:iron-siderophore ABC transporter substrate-binding protein n=1 Tax=Pseudomonas oryzihabitans TaxID=47885 RepID=UPI0028960A2E|nr:iron-siderophore ABC transporter substrate-binding protein [Pseudomonas oryzihabitans]MDT3723118.1 iron-siderophore ABC transporter substrate-binding protein [Pseudomonas oryzihabitans]